MKKSQKQAKREKETLEVKPLDPRQVLLELKKEALAAQKKFKTDKKS